MTTENPAPTETQAPVNPSSPEAALEAAQNRAREMEDQLLRLRADFDNFRRRNAKERQEWTQRCLEGILEDLIASLDHFELGLTAATNAGLPASALDGFRLVHQHLTGVVGKYGLERIEATGGAFDPKCHEALQTVPSADVPAQGVVMQVRAGYRLGDKLLRAAQVIVSGGAPQPAAPGQES